MTKKLKKDLLIGPFALLLFLMIFYVVSFGQTSGERIEIGQYSLKRASTPEFLVTGLNLNDLSRIHFSNMNKLTEGLAAQFGRVRTLFDKKTKKQVKITVAVYSSVNEAENMALELLNSISAVMKEGSQSGNVIGTHSWYLKSPNRAGTVLFIYNNSLFQLFSSDYNLVEKSALAIVNDLTKGVNGITLGKKVQLPKISDVILSKTVRKNEKVSLNITAFSPSQQRLSYVVLSSKGQILDSDKRAEKSYIPFESGTDELKIYAINEVNVVSQVFVKKLIIED